MKIKNEDEKKPEKTNNQAGFFYLHPNTVRFINEWFEEIEASQKPKSKF